jgi:XapX domain-containing protein
MKAYMMSLAIGTLVGVIYALFQVRSPAPPVIALVGLLGILLGEQIPPLIKQVWAKEHERGSWIQGQVRPHVFGELPCADSRSPTALTGASSRHELDNK